METNIELSIEQEVKAIRQRYERRKNLPEKSLYSPLRASQYMYQQEIERGLINWINECGIAPVAEKRLLEIGCGDGTNLLELIKLGFEPENLVGNELLEERCQRSIHLLPAATQILTGDASSLELDESSFDIVLQYTVFTSILDRDFQQRLANRVWSLVKPGGGVLWFDFVFDNPNNTDVKGVPIRRIHELFPDSEIKTWRLALAPPIARLVTRIHPSLYNMFNLTPLLRTHLLCWIKKIGS